MRILIDTRIYKKHTGLGRYIESVVRALSDDIYEVYTYGEHVFHHASNCYTSRSAWLTSSTQLVRLVKEYSINIYICPHFNYSFVRGVENIVVIHDLTPFISKHYLGRMRLLKLFYARRFFKNQIPKADRIFAVSENTKRDLQNFFGYENVEVCYPGDPLINLGPRNRVKNQYLYVGDSRPHKNIIRMLEIWNEICQDGVERNLLLIGSLPEIECASENVTKLGNISDSKLDEIYWSSDALFFLSENEGFGLPILEASNRNTKCIIYNKSSLQEIAKDENTFRIENIEKVDIIGLRKFLSTDIIYDLNLYEKYNWKNFNQLLKK